MQATQLITRQDGEEVEAFKFDIRLRVVVLSSSVPSEWATSFRQAIKGRARLSLERRPQLRAIYDELLDPE